MMRQDTVARISTWVSLALSAVCSILLCFVPFYANGKTLAQVSGWAILSVLALPVAAGLAPLLVPRRSVRIGSAVFLCLFVVVSGFSIGMGYSPSALALVVGASRR